MFNKIRKAVVNFSREQETKKKLSRNSSWGKYNNIKNEFNSRLKRVKERISELEAGFKKIQNTYRIQGTKIEGLIYI